MLGGVGQEKGILTYGLFAVSVLLACLEKLAFVANTISVERDWIIVVSDSLSIDRQELNSTMRRIDLVCKLVAPVGIGLLDGYSTKIAIWVVFAQNAISVLVEYFAIAHVYSAIPELGRGREEKEDETSGAELPHATHQTVATDPSQRSVSRSPIAIANIIAHLRPWKDYAQNPAFLASFSLSLLYLTVLSFASQMTTYLITLGKP
jgi:iron-regulated transporter 1